MSESEIAEFSAIRPASKDDIPAIRAMQELSFVTLGAGFYLPQEIAAFIARIGTMDDAVVDEGHFFVAVKRNGAIMASGGWSKLEPGYDRSRAAGAADRANRGIATIRSMFVDPSVARRGIASRLLAHVEHDAAQQGIRVLRLMATLSGLPFYSRHGWRAEGAKAIVLGDGLQFGCVSMSKPITIEHQGGAQEAQETVLEQA